MLWHVEHCKASIQCLTSYSILSLAPLQVHTPQTTADTEHVSVREEADKRQIHGSSVCHTLRLGTNWIFQKTSGGNIACHCCVPPICVHFANKSWFNDAFITMAVDTVPLLEEAKQQCAIMWVGDEFKLGCQKHNWHPAPGPQQERQLWTDFIWILAMSQMMCLWGCIFILYLSQVCAFVTLCYSAGCHLARLAPGTKHSTSKLSKWEGTN